MENGGSWGCLRLLFLAALPFSTHVAADQGHEHILALRNQAISLEHGEGVARDVPHAVRLYCEAARLGDTESQFNLGWIYANGRGLPRDDALAAFFFRAAAEQGHDHASRMVARVGEPVPQAPECMRDPAPDPVAQPEPAAEPLQTKSVAAPVFVPTSPEQRKVAAMVKKLGPKFGISPQLALAVIRAESNFNPEAVSPKSAQGLMQLIPETAERFGVEKPFDPQHNLRGGLAYLRWLLAYFRGNVELVAAGYNAGEGTVDRYRGVPPYPETRAYVKRIIEFYGSAQHPYDGKVVAPSAALFPLKLAKAR